MAMMSAPESACVYAYFFQPVYSYCRQCIFMLISVVIVIIECEHRRPPPSQRIQNNETPHTFGHIQFIGLNYSTLIIFDHLKLWDA